MKHKNRKMTETWMPTYISIPISFLHPCYQARSTPYNQHWRRFYILLTLLSPSLKKVEAAKFAHRLSQTATMRSIGARPNSNVIRECAEHGMHTDAYWRCQARHYTMTIYHPTGTCKMGPAADPMAVRISALILLFFVCFSFFLPSFCLPY